MNRPLAGTLKNRSGCWGGTGYITNSGGLESDMHRPNLSCKSLGNKVSIGEPNRDYRGKGFIRQGVRGRWGEIMDPLSQRTRNDAREFPA